MKGHNVYLCNGALPPKERARVLQLFRESREPCLLILSPIGLTGLNLDCANIVIIGVSKSTQCLIAIPTK